MDEALRKQWMMAEQDQQISKAIEREQSRLRNFIRKRVADQSDAEDILQEVFYELVEAYRMMKPVEAGHCLVVPGGPQPDHGPLPQQKAEGVK
jgi:hypothetical protein